MSASAPTTAAPKLLTIIQAAEWLGLSQGYLNSLRREGKGPLYLKLGIRIYYEPADLLSWLETQKRRNNEGVTLYGAAAAKHGSTVVREPKLVKGSGV